MRKMLIAFLIVAASAATFASPQKEQSSSTAVGPFVLGKTPVTFSFFDDNDVFTSFQFGVDYKAEKWEKENMLFDMQIIGSGGAADQKFATMIISNSLPDRVRTNRNQLPKLVEAGLVAPLDAYLPDSYLLKSMGKGAIDMLRSSDGHLYQFPDWMITRKKGNGNGGWMIQRSVYEALGSPKLETFDDLYSYLHQVKAKYPNMIPLAVTQNFTGGYVIFTGFAEDMLYNYISNYKAVAEGDKLVSIFKNDAFKQSLLYTAKLFREGLIDPDSFTINQDQDLERLPQAAVVASNNICFRGRTTRDALLKNDPNNEWVPIWPIHKAGLDKNKIYPNNYNRLGGTINVISSKAKNPEAIFRVMDWLFSPYGNLINWFGPPGLYWDDKAGFTPEGYPKNFHDSWFTATADEVAHAGSNRTGIGNTAIVDGMSEYFYQLDPTKVNWTKKTQITVCWRTSADATAFTNVEPSPDSDLGIIAQKVKDIFDQMYSKAMFASSDSDVLALLAKADKDADAAGFPKLLDSMTKIWQSDKAKLTQM